MFQLLVCDTLVQKFILKTLCLGFLLQVFLQEFFSSCFFSALRFHAPFLGGAPCAFVILRAKGVSVAFLPGIIDMNQGEPGDMAAVIGGFCFVHRQGHSASSGRRHP